MPKNVNDEETTTPNGCAVECEDDDFKKVTEVPGMTQTLKNITKLSLWPILGSCFHPVYTMVNAAVCGRLGEDYLAAFGLGSLTLGIMCISIITCFSMSVGTLVAQAKGAKNIKMVHTYLYRQYYLNTFVYAVTVIPLIFIKQIYGWIGQDPTVAELAAHYVWINLPGIYFFGQFMATQVTISNMGWTKISIITLSTASLVHFCCVMLFVNVFDWKFYGVCFATLIQFMTRFIMV